VSFFFYSCTESPHWDKRLLTTQSREMNGACNHFLSGPSFTQEENGKIVLAYFSDQLPEMMDPRRVTDHPVTAALTGQLIAQGARGYAFFTTFLSRL
jgi:hypothetical protein